MGHPKIQTKKNPARFVNTAKNAATGKADPSPPFPAGTTGTGFGMTAGDGASPPGTSSATRMMRTPHGRYYVGRAGPDFRNQTYAAAAANKSKTMPRGDQTSSAISTATSAQNSGERASCSHLDEVPGFLAFNSSATKASTHTNQRPWSGKFSQPVGQS